MDIYLVGGAVRDRQLDLPVRERDWVVVGATPEDMLAQGYTPVGKDFPVFLHPETKEEYALARTERKTGPGYTGFDVIAGPDITLEEDLLRRDLTINAMAETEDGELVDPYGGATDLANGVLRHVSPAFAEDPVRILRIARFAARFSQYGFHVAHDTNTLMRQMVTSGEVDYLVPERVWAELVKALDTGTPVHFFDVLNGCDALATLFPGLVPHYDNKAATTHGHDAACLPVLAASVELSDSTVIRFASLICDMGWNSDNNQLGDFCARHRVPNSYRDLAQLALKYRLLVHDIATLSAQELHELLVNLDALRRTERVEEFLRVCEADARATEPALMSYAPADVVQRACQAAAEVVIDTSGKGGREIGEAIRQARIEAIEKIL